MQRQEKILKNQPDDSGTDDEEIILLPSNKYGSEYRCTTIKSVYNIPTNGFDCHYSLTPILHYMLRRIGLGEQTSQPLQDYCV